MRGEKDLVIVPGVRADRAEPLEENRTVTKIGFLAVRTPHGSRSEFTPARVPNAVRDAVRQQWKTYFNP
jgi:2,5-furandicarboxylate decarboxylase 1